MPAPLDFMRQYRALRVNSAVENSPAEGICRQVTHEVQLLTYFMMSWTAGTDQREDYSLVTQRAAGAGAQDANQWYAQNRERIQTAAMGKGAPHDYELALEWAVRSGRIANPSQATLQQFANQHLGIDCSGFVTNYLCANGRRAPPCKPRAMSNRACEPRPPRWRSAAARRLWRLTVFAAWPTNRPTAANVSRRKRLNGARSANGCWPTTNSSTCVSSSWRPNEKLFKRPLLP